MVNRRRRDERKRGSWEQFSINEITGYGPKPKIKAIACETTTRCVAVGTTGKPNTGVMLTGLRKIG